MFGTYIGFGTVLLIAIIGGIYVIWDEKKNAHKSDTYSDK